MRPFFALAMLSASLATAEEKSVEIPLKTIWAYRMPGTRDINELDGGKAQKEFVEPLLKHIRDTWDNDHGLAVQGEELEALQRFYRIEVDEIKNCRLSADAPISLVFFNKPTYPIVHLQSVEKEGNRITVQYRLNPHRTAYSPQHLALIPLGKLDPGKYIVKMKRMPMGKSYRKTGLPEPSPNQESNICKSFSFKVANQE
jgi:hypothetical protein